MRRFLATYTVVALVGCSDVVTTRFATLEEARAQGALDRGWLPPCLPHSARAIVERNDLDVNTGIGSFAYELSDRGAYMQRLLRAGAWARAEAEADILTVTTNGSRWEIRLPRQAGQATWNLRRL